MRVPTWTIVIFFAAGCGGPPTRIVAGRTDTVLVNSRKPVLLPVHAVDAKGHEKPTTGIRYSIAAGTA